MFNRQKLKGKKKKKNHVCKSQFSVQYNEAYLLSIQTLRGVDSNLGRLIGTYYKLTMTQKLSTVGLNHDDKSDGDDGLYRDKMRSYNCLALRH